MTSTRAYWVLTLMLIGSQARADAPTTIPSVWAPASEVTSKPAPRGELPIRFGNSAVELGFRSAEQGFGLASMVLKSNGREALSRVDERTRFWAVEIRMPDDKRIVIDHLTAPAGKYVVPKDAAIGDQAQFVWDEIKVPEDGGAIGVTVTVSLDRGSPLARMRIAVKNRLQKAGLWKVTFPRLNYLGYPGESDCLVPTTFSMMNQGELHRRATGLLSQLYMGKSVAEYPSGGVPIQHLSCSIGDDTVVYIGWHDGQANLKGYEWTMEDALSIHAWPADMSKPGADYTQEWDCVVGPMRGDWFDATQVYRAFAIQQFWCAKGPLEKRTDLPREFFEVPYWGDPSWPPAGYQDKDADQTAKASTLPSMWRPGDNSFDREALASDVMREEMIWRTNRSVETLGLPLGVQWYNWHHCRFDGNYPDYFPPRPGFAEYLRDFPRKPGLFVHGFINGMWFDRSLPEFKESAFKYTAVMEDEFNHVSKGEVDPLKFSKGCALMCPSTEYWQKRMAGIAEQMAKLGFNGAYLDVFANAGNLLCFDPSHGHPLGAGHWFSRAQRAVADGMKGPGKLTYITSESFNETLGQSVDLFYQWNDWRTDCCPLLGSVYGGYLQWYGSRAFKKIHDDTDDDDVSFLAKITRDVFWGGHLSFYVTWDMAKGQDWVHQQVAQLVDLQRRAKKYLTYGQMTRPPRSTGPIPQIDAPAWNRWSRDKPPPIRIDAVETAAWRASDGTVALFLMNYDTKPHTIEFDVPGGAPLKVEVPSRAPMFVELHQ